MKLSHFFLLFCFSLFALSCDKDKYDCIDPNLIDLDSPITLDYNPVCGCDGITYQNESSATVHGVTSWTQGPCDSDIPVCDSATVFQVIIDPSCGLIVKSFDDQFYEVNEVYGDITFLEGQYIAVYYTVSPQLGSCSGYYVINITRFCNFTDCLPIVSIPIIISPGPYPFPYWADDFHINSAWIEDDCINLSVTYSGGCETHLFRLVKAFNTFDTPPLTRTFKLDHQGFDDACDALITETISFNLTGAVTPSDTSIKIINISDGLNTITISL